MCLKDFLRSNPVSYENDGISTNYSSDQKSEYADGKMSTPEGLEDIKIDPYEQLPAEDNAWLRQEQENYQLYTHIHCQNLENSNIYKRDSAFQMENMFLKREEEYLFFTKDIDFNLDNFGSFTGYGLNENKSLNDLEFHN